MGSDRLPDGTGDGSRPLSDYEAAVAAAEAELLAAREAWQAQRGETPDSRQGQAAARAEERKAIKAGELRFLAARRAWLQGREAKANERAVLSTVSIGTTYWASGRWLESRPAREAAP
jgi:Ni/Co efflux regulator RcnB